MESTTKLYKYSDKDDNEYILYKEVKEIVQRGYDDEDDITIPVILEEIYIMQLSASFIIGDDGVNAITVRRGFREINGLAYTYSVVIYSYHKYSMYTEAKVYGDAGIKCTEMDMYSYHTMNPFKYMEDQLLYDLRKSLNLSQLLC